MGYGMAIGLRSISELDRDKVLWSLVHCRCSPVLGVARARALCVCYPRVAGTPSLSAAAVGKSGAGIFAGARSEFSSVQFIFTPKHRAIGAGLLKVWAQISYAP
jgi:hypothetical protein